MKHVYSMICVLNVRILFLQKENEQSPAELTKLQYKQKIKVPLTVAMNCKK